MKRFNLPLASFALAAMAGYLALAPLSHTRAGVVLFLGACLLACFGVGMLWRAAALPLVAIALYVCTGPWILTQLSQTYANVLLVTVAYPSVLMLAALGLNWLLKRRAERAFQRKYFPRG